MQTFLPSRCLRPFIRHYWLSHNSPATTHCILPDGSIDLVVQWNGNEVASWLFGTSTEATDISLGTGNHYLGIRFRPGQARHFIDIGAQALTDNAEEATPLLRFSLEPLWDALDDGSHGKLLDGMLQQHLHHSSPVEKPIDAVVDWIERSRGSVSIAEAAGMYGKSRRQLERDFLDLVGVSPKLFASIVRFEQVTQLLRQPQLALASVALNCGFTDQSHMTNEFRRLAGCTPKRYRQQHVAFFQDGADASAQNDSFHQ
ncbi:AraC family transcriptional regulator [Bremerella cremea]|uniref:AraC family transcriptional regulator n=1 Tax=Bremerella cremea TaxID=1031537 RepID=UPI0031F015CB